MLLVTTSTPGPALAGPGAAGPNAAAPNAARSEVNRLTEVVFRLAADDLTGRRIGTPGSAVARSWLSSRLKRTGAWATTSDFTAQVRDVYATPVLHIDGWRELTHRRDFAEHLASADAPKPRDAPLTNADDPDVDGRWVLAPAYHPEAALSAVALGAVGLLVPRGVDEAGWMPKMIAGPPACDLPVLSVRTDLHQQLLAAAMDKPLRVRASAPLRTIEVTGVNLHGVFAEAAPGGMEVLLTAHYDGVGDDPQVRLPAAADNASGVAVVLEAARLLGPLLPEGVGLQVALLDGEEVGARGSAHHAPAVRPGTFVINVDGAAARGDAAAVEAAGPAEPLLAALDQAGRELGVPLRAGSMGSDNRRYGAAGLAAIGIGMGLPGYQTPAETPDRVDPATLAAATDLVVRTVLRLVQSSTYPSIVDRRSTIVTRSARA